MTIRSAVRMCVVCQRRPARGKSDWTCKGCSPGRNKFSNNPVNDPEDGWFQSTGEHERWRQLRQWESLGLLTNLRRQVKFPLTVNGTLITTYIADFVYEVVDLPGRRRGDTVTEDFKGKVTDEFQLKAKLLQAIEGIEVTIVRRADLGR